MSIRSTLNQRNPAKLFLHVLEHTFTLNLHKQKMLSMVIHAGKEDGALQINNISTLVSG